MKIVKTGLKPIQICGQFNHQDGQRKILICKK